jgi:hypothetical protein
LRTCFSTWHSRTFRGLLNLPLCAGHPLPIWSSFMPAHACLPFDKHYACMLHFARTEMLCVAQYPRWTCTCSLKLEEGNKKIEYKYLINHCSADPGKSRCLTLSHTFMGLNTPLNTCPRKKIHTFAPMSWLERHVSAESCHLHDMQP